MVFRGTGWCSENHRRVVKGIGDGPGETGLKESIERYPWEHAAMYMGIGIRGLVGDRTPWVPGLLKYTYFQVIVVAGYEFYPNDPGPIPDYLRDAWKGWRDPRLDPFVCTFNEPVQKVVYNEDPPPNADADIGERYRRMKRNRTW